MVGDKVKQFVMKQKYRWNVGVAWLAVFNFLLLVITAASKIRGYLGLSHDWEVAVILVPLAFLGVWGFGFVFVKFVRDPYRLEVEHAKYSYIFQVHNAKHDLILGKLDELEKKINYGKVVKNELGEQSEEQSVD